MKLTQISEGSPLTGAFEIASVVSFVAISRLNIHSKSRITVSRLRQVHPGPIDTEMLKVRTPEENRERLNLVPMSMAW
jgi:hypothetical protein